MPFLHSPSLSPSPLSRLLSPALALPIWAGVKTQHRDELQQHFYSDPSHSAVISPGICIYIFSLHYPLSLESFWHHLFTLFVVLKTLSDYVYDQQACNQNQNHTLLLPSVSWPLQVWHFLCPTEAAAFCTVWCLQNFSKWKTQSPRCKLFGVIRSTVNLLILGARVCSSAESSSALTCLAHQWHENVPQIVETVFWTNWDNDCVFWVLTLLGCGTFEFWNFWHFKIIQLYPQLWSLRHCIVESPRLYLSIVLLYCAARQ